MYVFTKKKKKGKKEKGIIFINYESLCWKMYSFLQAPCFDYPEQSYWFFIFIFFSLSIPFSISLINRLSTMGLGLYEMYFLGLKLSFRVWFAIHNVKAAQMCPGDLWQIWASTASYWAVLSSQF